MTAAPEKIHVSKELKYGKPLISCRFDPAGRFVFAGAEDDSVQRWDLTIGPGQGQAGFVHRRMTAGCLPWRSRMTARRSCPAAPTAS